MSKQNKRMQTSINFGDDGNIEVHNNAIGDQDDHCEQDIASIRKLFEGDDGVEVVTDRSLACNSPTTSSSFTTQGLNNNQKRKPANTQSTQQHIQVEGD
ncbi:MAG TPA: hypothetical protein PK833_03460 [Vicingus sp.]|nr:hypothetical protein [Vicingus sp.]